VAYDNKDNIVGIINTKEFFLKYSDNPNLGFTNDKPRFTFPIVTSLLEEHKEKDTVLHKKISEIAVDEFIWAFVS
jgi:CBS domain containing-hemolysin-like protein